MWQDWSRSSTIYLCHYYLLFLYLQSTQDECAISVLLLNTFVIFRLISHSLFRAFMCKDCLFGSSSANINHALQQPACCEYCDLRGGGELQCWLRLGHYTPGYSMWLHLCYSFWTALWPTSNVSVFLGTVVSGVGSLEALVFSSWRPSTWLFSTLCRVGVHIEFPSQAHDDGSRLPTSGTHYRDC